MNKILILSPYYNRPISVRRMLESIKNSTHINWELACIDDGSIEPYKDIVAEVFNEEEIKKVKFYQTGDSVEKKLELGGSRHPKYMNKAMEETDADIVVYIDDDDEFFLDYFEKLSNWYDDNLEENWAYSHIKCINAWETAHSPEWWELDDRFNKIGRQRPSCLLDASQVTWRTSVIKSSPEIRYNDITYDFCTDADMFNKLQGKYPSGCLFTGLTGIKKYFTPKQLSWQTQHGINPLTQVNESTNK